MNKNLIAAVLLLCLLLASGFERSVNITEIGINASDVTHYWDTAKEWSEGNKILTRHYRPLIYQLYGYAINVFGQNDYSIKVFNIIVDLINIAIIYFIAYLSTRQKILSLLPAFVYAFSPLAIAGSRTELVHAASTLPVLLSALCAFKTIDCIGNNIRKFVLYGFLTGLFVGASANIHPDLIVIVLIYFLLFSWCTYSRVWRHSVTTESLGWISGIVAYCIGFLTLFLIYSIQYGPLTIIKCFLSNAGTQAAINKSNFFTTWLQVLLHFIQSNTSTVFLAIIFALFATRILLRVVRQKKFTLFELTIYSLCLSHITFYSLIASRYMLARLFLPFIPLLLVLTHVQLQRLFVNKRIAAGVVVMISFISLLSFRGFNTEMSLTKNTRPILYRVIYNELRGKVNSDNRLLLAPSIIYSDRIPLKSAVYFGESNVDFISDYKMYPSLDAAIQKNKIRYVFFAKDLLDFRGVANSDEKKINYTQFFYRKNILKQTGKFNLDEEKKIIYKLLSNYKPKVVDFGDYGQLFILN